MSTAASFETENVTPTAAAIVVADADASMDVETIMEIDEVGGNKKAGPGGKHDSMRTYSPDEAALVFKLVEEHAPRWTHIAKLVSEATKQPRTAASVRNYYKRFCASKKIAERDSAVRKLNRCQACGMIKRGHICKGPKEVEYASPKGLKAATESRTNADAAPAPAAAARPPAAEPTVLLAPTPPAQTTGGLVLSSSKDDKPLPPLAPAALEVLMPGAGLTHSPAGLSTPGPLSLSAFSMLGSPSMLAALGLPTPASMPPSVAAAAAAAFPFTRPLTSRNGADDEITPDGSGVDEETVLAEGEVRDCVDAATALSDIGTLPMASATVEVKAE